MTAGGRVSLTLSDSFCVARHRDDFLDLVAVPGRRAVRERGRDHRAVRGRRRSTTRCSRCATTATSPHSPARRTARSSSPATRCTCIDAYPTTRGRHHGGRRPVRGRLPLRAHSRHASRRVREARARRRGRGDQPLRASPRDVLLHTPLVTTDLVEAATRWLEEDPDPDTRAELSALLARGRHRCARRSLRRAAAVRHGRAAGRARRRPEPHEPGDRAAGRGRARATTCSTRCPARRRRGVVIGCDARHKSDVFAEDTAAVLAAPGSRALLLPPQLPTPVLAFAVRHLGCAAGVMVTASHNPPADNGYKVYLGDGAQIVPPADAEIAAAIDAVGPLSTVPLASLDDPLVDPARQTTSSRRYLARVEVALSLVPSARDVSDRLHRDARRRRAIGRRCVRREPASRRLHVVAAQADPDPDFPTVAFPNPEEPGALDLALAEAARVERRRAAIANDPDADRLGAAIPDGDGVPAPARRRDRLAARPTTCCATPRAPTAWSSTTVVSSTLLSKMAAAAGVHYAETLPGSSGSRVPALDRPEHALRVRLRGGARLPRGRRRARQGRHHRRAGAWPSSPRWRRPRASRCRTVSMRWRASTGCTRPISGRCGSKVRRGKPASLR